MTSDDFEQLSYITNCPVLNMVNFTDDEIISLNKEILSMEADLDSLYSSTSFVEDIKNLIAWMNKKLA